MGCIKGSSFQRTWVAAFKGHLQVVYRSSTGRLQEATDVFIFRGERAGFYEEVLL